MEWPAMVHTSEVQTRLISDGIPIERAMQMASEIATVSTGNRYRVGREQGDLYLYATVHPGYFAVATE